PAQREHAPNAAGRTCTSPEPLGPGEAQRRPERRAKLSPTSETAHGGRRLVIVESPAKAKTIKGYLGPGYTVEASVGHIRDLPNGAAEVPEKYTGEVRRLGVDVEHDFQPVHV